jgi:hypothetical protein
MPDGNGGCDACYNGQDPSLECQNDVCKSGVRLSDGSVRCLSCNSEGHFQYNASAAKCTCKYGFYLDEANQTCTEKCGDGILANL